MDPWQGAKEFEWDKGNIEKLRTRHHVEIFEWLFQYLAHAPR